MRNTSAKEEERIEKLKSFEETLKANKDRYFNELKQEELSNYRPFKLIGWMFEHRNLISKKRIFISHLKKLNESLQAERIEIELNDFDTCRIDEFIKKNSGNRPNQMEIRLEAIEGLKTFYSKFDERVRRVIKNDSVSLLVSELIFVAISSVSVAYLTSILRYFIMEKEPSIVLIFWAGLLPLILIFIGLHLTMNRIHRRKEIVRLKKRQVLNIMIYRKLNLSDSNFLEHSDNNMIYKLMYLEFEDYIKYAHNYGGGVFMINVAVLCGWICVNSRNVVGYTFCLISCLAVLLRALIKLTYNRKEMRLFKAILFENRRNLDEFISNFKILALMNLKNRIEFTSKNFICFKHKILSRLNIAKLAEKSVISLLTLGIFYVRLITPMKRYVSSTNLKKSVFEVIMKSTGIDNSDNAVSDSPIYFAMLIAIFCLIGYLIHQAVNDLDKYITYKSSIFFFDKFFKNDFFTLSQIIQNRNIPEGSIKIRDATVSLRNNRKIGLSINHLLLKGEEYEQISKFVNTKKFRGEETVKTKMNRNISNGNLKTIQRSRKSMFVSNQSLNLNRKKQMKEVFSKINLEIPFGSRICIYESGNKKCVKSFISMIIGESFISNGTVSINGTFSYYNPKKMHFLIGKSIRQNILFDQEYNEDRYERILKLLNLQFGNYHGYDLCQILEKASNLRNEDIREILLARFLYKDADIYIMEDCLSRVNQSLIYEEIKFIFNTWLRHKTIIYDSTDIDMIKMSNRVLKFDIESKLVSYESGKFITLMGISANTEEVFEKISRHKGANGQILKKKFKNSVFFENLTYEEELIIFKKKEKQRKEIELLKKDNPSTLEMLSYGIYLTNKRRQEGINLENPNHMKPSVALKELRKIILRRKHFMMMTFIVLMYSIGICLQIALEILILKTNKLSEGGDIHDKNRHYYACVGLIVSLILYHIFKSWALNKYISRILLDINHKILSSILNSGIRAISVYKSDRLLEKMSSEVMNIETRVLDIIEDIIQSITFIMILGIGQFIIYSFLIPFAVLGFFLLSMMWIKDKLEILFFSIAELTMSHNLIITEINYQILGLIRGYRINNTMAKLKARQLLQSNQSTRLHELYDSAFCLFVNDVVFWAALVWGFVFGCVFLCFKAFPVLRLQEQDEYIMIFGCLNWFRIFYTCISMPRISEGLLPFVSSLIKLVNFVEKMEQSQNRNYYKHAIDRITKHECDYKAPLILKNVSLTLGYQPILKRLNLKVASGEKVGIFGFEGGGRSSIFDLITGIVERDQLKNSNIMIFGMRIEELEPDVLTREVFFMANAPVLIEGTLRNNIDPYSQFTSEEIKAKLIELDFSQIYMRGSLHGSGIVVGDGGIGSFKFINSGTKKVAQLGIDGQSEDFDILSSDDESDESNGDRGEELSRNIDNNNDDIQNGIRSDKIIEKKELNDNDNVNMKIKMKSFRKKSYSQSNERSQKKNESSFKRSKTSRSLDPIVIGSAKKNLTVLLEERDQHNKIEVGLIQNRVHHADNQKTETRGLFSKIDLGEQNLDLYKESEVRGKDSNIDLHEIPELPSFENKISEKEDIEFVPMSEKLSSRNSKRINEPDPEFLLDIIQDLNTFLNISCGFEARNININTRRYVAYCRVIMTKPKILLLNEQSLSFGLGITRNLKKLIKELPDTTIISIMNHAETLLHYDQIAFMDGGLILESGDPKTLVSSKESYISRFLNEVDKKLLKKLCSETNANKESKEFDLEERGENIFGENPTNYQMSKHGKYAKKQIESYEGRTISFIERTEMKMDKEKLMLKGKEFIDSQKSEHQVPLIFKINVNNRNRMMPEEPIEVSRRENRTLKFFNYPTFMNATSKIEIQNDIEEDEEPEPANEGDLDAKAGNMKIDEVATENQRVSKAIIISRPLKNPHAKTQSQSLTVNYTKPNQ